MIRRSGRIPPRHAGRCGLTTDLSVLVQVSLQTLRISCSKRYALSDASGYGSDSVQGHIFGIDIRVVYPGCPGYPRWTEPPQMEPTHSGLILTCAPSCYANLALAPSFFWKSVHTIIYLGDESEVKSTLLSNPEESSERKDWDKFRHHAPDTVLRPPLTRGRVLSTRTAASPGGYVRGLRPEHADCRLTRRVKLRATPFSGRLSPGAAS